MIFPHEAVDWSRIMTYLGIDVSGTKVVLRIESRDGDREAYQASFPWPAPAGAVRRDLEVLGEHLRHLTETWGSRVEHAAVAFPAALDREGRVTAWPSRPAWAGVRALDAFRSILPGATVSCADDGALAALAEARQAGLTDLLYLGVGTGLGCGVVLGGRLIPGLGRGSAEVAHLLVQHGGPRCDCGRSGCLQAVASGRATLRRAARLRGTEVAHEALVGGFAAQEAWAVEAVSQTCAMLAAAAVGLSELLHPQAVVVGGGFAAGLPGFVPEIARRLAPLQRAGQGLPELREAAFGALSSLPGALLLARGAV